MRPRPKIHPFPLPSAAALLLCLAALIFSLCYEDPNYAQTDDFASTYWWGGAFGMLAIIECSIDLFVSPTDQKRDIDGFLTSALEFALLIIVLQSYFSHYADTEGTYRAPRYAAMIALILIAVLSATYKVLDFTHPDFFKDPLRNLRPVAQVPGKVSIYCCGPTVYNDPHIGNFRPVIVFRCFAAVFHPSWL
jgi:hypothetical protein